MEKTSKITRSVFKTDFESKYGKMYNHLITLENGDTGTVATKDKEPEKLNPGKEITYTIEETDFGFKIKLVNNTQSQGGWKDNKKTSNYQPADPRVQNIGFAMAYAKDLIVAGIVPFGELDYAFETVYSAMDKKYLQVKGEQPKAEEPKQEEKNQKTNEKSTPEQHNRAEAIINEGTLFSKEERSKTIEKIKASTKSVAEGLITKLIVESGHRKSVLLQEAEQESDLPF